MTPESIVPLLSSCLSTRWSTTTHDTSTSSSTQESSKAWPALLNTNRMRLQKRPRNLRSWANQFSSCSSIRPLWAYLARKSAKNTQLSHARLAAKRDTLKRRLEHRPPRRLNAGLCSQSSRTIAGIVTGCAWIRTQGSTLTHSARWCRVLASLSRVGSKLKIFLKWGSERALWGRLRPRA